MERSASKKTGWKIGISGKIGELEVGENATVVRIDAIQKRLP